jgi:hypothetical protein
MAAAGQTGIGYAMMRGAELPLNDERAQDPCVAERFPVAPWSTENTEKSLSMFPQGQACIPFTLKYRSDLSDYMTK